MGGKDELQLTLDGSATMELPVGTEPSGAAPQANGPERTITPTSLGDYELVNEIARGGMGVVYRARHRTLGRHVALKVILSGQFASPADIRRFHMEAESAAALDHSGIVPIYDIGELEGTHFFTMKLIEGGSLGERMAGGELDLNTQVTWIADVADAIDYAHRRGILHRDLKPANILIDLDDKPWVTDLGLAKHVQSDVDLTGTGAVVGTPAYMSPEQATASREVTTSADIFSLGAMLYHALTGRPPHQADSAVATLMQAAQGEVTRPRQFNTAVDSSLELICLKCLAKDPEDRYPVAGLLALDLRAWLRGDPVSVRPPSVASSFAALIANQLHSVIGAVALGSIGGVSIGLPLYAGLARGIFGSEDAPFNLRDLKEAVPEIPFEPKWWLEPPGALPEVGFVVGLFYALLLGWLINRLAKPSDARQAIASGLVAGMFMAFVQFAFYGVGCNWQAYRLQHADTISLLSRAAFADGNERQTHLSSLEELVPGLDRIPVDQHGTVVGQVVSSKIMLQATPVFLASLLACILFSLGYCVAGTLHAHRLSVASHSRLVYAVRYGEVSLLLSLLSILGVACVFMVFGMVRSGAEGRAVYPGLQILTCLGMVGLACLPGFLQARWQVRWACYVATFIGVLMVAR
ncbi:MAG: serine/threonine-protein kinase [Planctomycetota bacterium]